MCVSNCTEDVQSEMRTVQLVRKLVGFNSTVHYFVHNIRSLYPVLICMKLGQRTVMLRLTLLTNLRFVSVVAINP